MFTETRRFISRYLNIGYFKFQGKKGLFGSPLPPFNRAIKKEKLAKELKHTGMQKFADFLPPELPSGSTHSGTCIPQNPFVAHEKTAFPVAAKRIGLP